MEKGMEKEKEYKNGEIVFDGYFENGKKLLSNIK